MEFKFYDEDGELYILPGKFVACSTSGCENEGVQIEVADDPNGSVVCGPCGQWIIPPIEA